ncbi:thymocyte nuclear protein 1 isoform 1 [Moniliophthora roreri MCA 2997]|uniref:Thymocyte nuclear protein 1 isoform 1 n=1 Tax=Moniliophthora roreri (strain MCA 2997) TaxID=1381753 RepID=V2XK85_MONRO|nr:thymocyte nuclear protein 1 isoform 1 [Moniliophthora roreri MCA 2997]
MSRFWLLKAEPDSRIVNGKDVKFSVDDFEAVKTSPWEGVRNYEARNLMKEMKTGDKALFYHSNCKNPGIAGFAEVSKEAYPDYTAWDKSHPYFDAKSSQSSPKWFMVDLTFSSRAANFIPLSLLRLVASYSSGSDLPESLAYIGEDGARAIKNMDLVTRGRLSVQRVDQKAFDTIVTMAGKGGWDELALESKKTPSTSRTKAAANGKPKTAPAKRSPTTRKAAAATPKKAKVIEEDEEDEDAYVSEPSSEDEYSASDDGSDYGKSKGKSKANKAKGKKRKLRGAKDDDDDDGEYTGRSPRRRKKA